MDEPQAPAEGRLIDAAQKSAVPKLSMRQAAAAAGISEGRWRQIVKGYQGTGSGRIPVVAPDETVARMALAVGITADQLNEAGRPKAADVLRLLVADSDQPDVELKQVSTDRLLSEIRRRIEGVGYGLEVAQESGASGETSPSQKIKPAGLNRADQGESVDHPEDRRLDETARRAAGRMREAAEQDRKVE